MRKLIYSLLTLAILGVVVVPYVDGLMLQKDFNKRFAQIPQTNKLKFTLKSFDRGWYHSTAKVTLDILDPIYKKGMLALLKSHNNPNPKLDDINIEMDLMHGPMVFSHLMDGDMHPSFGLGQIRSRLILPPNLVAKFTPYFAEHVPLIAQTTVHFDGSSLTSYKTTALRVKDKKGELNWDGIKGYFKISANFDDINAHSTITPAVFKNKNIEVTSLPMTSKGHATKGYGGLWYGQSSIHIPEVLGQMNGKPEFILQNLNLQTNQQSHDSKLLSRLILKLEKVTISKFIIGPGEFKLSLDELDVDTLVKLRNLLNDLNNQDRSTPAYHKAIQNDIKPLVLHLFQKGVIVNLENLHLGTPIGDINSQGKVSIPSTADSSKKFKQIFESAKVNLHVSLPPMIATAWLSQLNRKLSRMNDSYDPAKANDLQENQRQTQRLMKTWLERGILVKDGQNFALNLQYHDKTWSINNKTIRSITDILPPPEKPKAPAAATGDSTPNITQESIQQPMPTRPMPQPAGTPQQIKPINHPSPISGRTPKTETIKPQTFLEPVKAVSRAVLATKIPARLLSHQAKPKAEKAS